MGNSIVSEASLLENIPALKKRQLRRLRREGRIPHLRLGPRGILYDLDSVVAALRKREVSR
jgi:hypothetical protein